VWRACGRVRAGSDHGRAVGLPAGLLLGLASPAGRTRSGRGGGPTERPPVLWDISRAALARHVKARTVAVSTGIASRSRCDPSLPVNLTVCAPPAHQSSRTLEPPMITSWRGQKFQASAFIAIRRTTPSRLATAAIRAGSSAAGSRVRGHQAPFRTSLDVNDAGNASRTLTGVDAVPGDGMPRLLSRTDMISALLPPGPQSDRNRDALTTTQTWTLTLGMPSVGPPYSRLTARGDSLPLGDSARLGTSCGVGAPVPVGQRTWRSSAPCSRPSLCRPRPREPH
jgi:hypothetical protein